MQIIRFGADGWSDRIGEGFSDESCARVADAVGKLWASDHPGTAVIVGYDTRRGAARYARLVAEVVASHGMTVKLSDTFCPMPALCWALAHDPDACGGIMLTASNASSEYLGIRLRSSEGSSVSVEDVRTIEALIESKPTHARGVVDFSDIMTPYLAGISSLIDADAVREAGLTIVHDPMYGASKGLITQTLGGMGADVCEIHGDTSDDFGGIHPDPIEPWVDDCEQAVVAEGACAGFVNDGDGDRVGTVDENGDFVNPHIISALVLGHLVENRNARGRVVINLAGSAYVRRQAARLGCDIAVTPIGFRRLYIEMLKHDVLVSSDSEGGICIPSHLMERDGVLVDLLLAELMAKTSMTMGQLVNDLESKVGHMDYGRRDIQLDAATVQAFRNMLPGINPARVAGRVPQAVSHADGLRLQFDDDSWVLMRPSRTENLVRVYAEASTVEQRDALLDGGCSIARGDE